jgi:hypothetical protein
VAITTSQLVVHGLVGPADGCRQKKVLQSIATMAATSKVIVLL